MKDLTLTPDEEEEEEIKWLQWRSIFPEPSRKIHRIEFMQEIAERREHAPKRIVPPHVLPKLKPGELLTRDMSILMRSPRFRRK